AGAKLDALCPVSMETHCTMLPPLMNKFSGFMQRRPRLERRSTKRLTPGGMTPCLIREDGADEPIPTWVHNLSLSGIGIVSTTPRLPDTILHVVIFNATHTSTLSSAVKVARCNRAGGTHWLLGCVFTSEISHEQLEPFLR